MARHTSLQISVYACGRGLRAGRATHGQVFVVRQGSALEGRVAPYLVEDGERFSGTFSGLCSILRVSFPQ